MTAITWISFTLLFFYAALILIYWAGWFMIPYFRFTDEESSSPDTFSVLVPSRNEEKNIGKCLADLAAQKYDPSLFEIIVINDHSQDNTEKVVRDFISDHPGIHVRLLNMQDDPQQRKLKKAAITFGISHTVHKYIILTDADCERGDSWLSAISAFMNKKDLKMVYAPVAFRAGNVFEKMQSLEFAGLVGIGGSAIRLGQPNMCSAANLIFEKEVFDEVEGYKGYDGLASGDDEFLMHKVFRRYPGKVSFMKNREAIVYTSANKSVSELTDQRRRWVSKSTRYENRFITAILVAAYLFNALILFNLIFQPVAGMAMFFIKMIIEGLFLFSVMRFFRRTEYLLLLPLAEVLHIVYVLVIGIWANTGRYQWKGRTVS